MGPSCPAPSLPFPLVTCLLGAGVAVGGAPWGRKACMEKGDTRVTRTLLTGGLWGHFPSTVCGFRSFRIQVLVIFGSTPCRRVSVVSEILSRVVHSSVDYVLFFCSSPFRHRSRPPYQRHSPAPCPLCALCSRGTVRFCSPRALSSDPEVAGQVAPLLGVLAPAVLSLSLGSRKSCVLRRTRFQGRPGVGEFAELFRGRQHTVPWLPRVPSALLASLP